MATRIGTRLAITHAITALVTVVLVVLASHYLFNERFIHYLDEKQIKHHSELIEDFSKAYQSGKWDQAILEKVGVQYLLEGYLVKLKDPTGKTLWNSEMVDQQVYQRAMAEIKNRQLSHFGEFQPSLQTNKYKLEPKQGTTAVLEISYYSTHFLTDHDLMFLKYLNNALLWIAGLSFLTALGVSTLLSRKFSSQITAVIDTAQAMAKGSRNISVDLEQSNVEEIKNLGAAIKYLDCNLKEKEASNKRLTADIAHELRTPLSTLQGHLEAMLEGIWKPTQERLVSCHEEIIRMIGLVNNLEKLNKYDTGQIKLSKTEFDLAELTKNIATNFEGSFLKKKINFKYAGQDCAVFADREKMGQVIVNLLSNSLKYTVEGGRVFISVSADEQFAYLVVNDSGIGIAREDLPKIFNRLYRTDRSRARATGGAGIGLAIAKAIIEAHRGQIEVVSQEGKGTEFTVIIPITSAVV